MEQHHKGSAPVNVNRVMAAAGESELNPIVVAQGTASTPKTIQGSIWEDSVKSGPNLTSIYDLLGKDAYVGNVDLFYQWMDADGSMSPIYKTTSNADGTFYNVVPDHTDAFGITHSFKANINRESIRVWVDPVWLQNNDYYSVLDSYNGGFGNYNFTKPTVWISQKVTEYFIALQKRPDLSKIYAADNVVDLGITPETYNHANWVNEFKGYVFWDLAYADAATGDPMLTSGDLPAAGVTVYMSRAETDDGSTVANKTWKVTTNSKGEFLFKVDPTVIINNEYRVSNVHFFVDTQDPALKNAMQWRPVGANRFVKLIDVERGATAGLNSIQDVKLAIRPDTGSFEIVNYDTSTRIATPGDTAFTAATGWSPEVAYTIRWDRVEKVGDNEDASFTQVSSSGPFYADANGTLPVSEFTVPKDLAENTYYRAVLVGPNGIDLLIDSFIGVVADATTPIGAEGAAYTGQVNPPVVEGHTFTYEIDTTSQEAIDGGFGPLPDGLVLNADGSISGTPAEGTAGAHKVRFKVQGQSPVDGAPAYDIYVEKTIYILDGNIPNPAMETRTVDNNIVKLITDGSDVLPENYTLTAEIIDLPADVTYSGGQFGGAPAVDADTETTTHDVQIKYTVTYPDPKDPTQTITETVTQVQKPFVVLENLTVDSEFPSGSVGLPYSTTAPEALGGEGPYTFTSTPLPAGLTLNEDGSISGTPTTMGTTPTTITVTDKYGYTATDQGDIVIDNKSAPPVIDPVGDKDKVVTGTGIPGSEIVVTFPDGTTTATTTVKDDGTWSVDVPETVTLAVDDKITATQQEVGKDVSAPADTTVIASVIPVTDPDTPTPDGSYADKDYFEVKLITPNQYMPAAMVGQTTEMLDKDNNTAGTVEIIDTKTIRATFNTYVEEKSNISGMISARFRREQLYRGTTEPVDITVNGQPFDSDATISGRAASGGFFSLIKGAYPGMIDKKYVRWYAMLNVNAKQASYITYEDMPSIGHRFDPNYRFSVRQVLEYTETGAVKTYGVTLSPSDYKLTILDDASGVARGFRIEFNNPTPDAYFINYYTVVVDDELGSEELKRTADNNPIFGNKGSMGYVDDTGIPRLVTMTKEFTALELIATVTGETTTPTETTEATTTPTETTEATTTPTETTEATTTPTETTEATTTPTETTEETTTPTETTEATTTPTESTEATTTPTEATEATTTPTETTEATTTSETSTAASTSDTTASTSSTVPTNQPSSSTSKTPTTAKPTTKATSSAIPRTGEQGSVLFPALILILSASALLQVRRWMNKK